MNKNTMTVRGERVLWQHPRRRDPVVTWADPSADRVRLITANGTVLIDTSWPLFKQQVHRGWLLLTGEVDAELPVFDIERLLGQPLIIMDD